MPGIRARSRLADRVIAVRLECRSMQAIRPALGGHDDGCRTGEFGGRNVVLHLELLDRVQPRRPPEYPTHQPVRRGRAVEHELRRSPAHPKRARGHGIVLLLLLHTGHGLQQRRDEPAVDRQLLDALILEHMTERRVVHRDQGRHIRHLHLGRGLADFQYRIHYGALLYRHGEGPLELLHALRLHRQAVRPRDDARKDVEPATLVVLRDVILVPVLTRVTVAPGITAFVWSRTVPRIVVVLACGQQTPADTRSRTTADSDISRIRSSFPLQ